jgi:hypothetical protein
MARGASHSFGDLGQGVQSPHTLAGREAQLLD